MKEKCGTCERPNGLGKRELRPYGPGGTNICFECATSTPKANAEAKRQFGAKLKEAGPRSFLTEDGPLPFVIPKEMPEA